MPINPKDETWYIPMGVAEKKSRLERFAELNRWVTARGGWIVSLPGADPVVVECLPGSTLVGELTEAGYELTSTGEGERIVLGQIVQRFATTSSGMFEAVTTSSTRPTVLTTKHAAIAQWSATRFRNNISFRRRD
ncbi:hypothetical protein [Bradyrhizobium aeschynomenes]|uniref:hypothetical protein n=1 Tax=Bradyrhizobium aeschynomenes TaxID=2734909 RepID=UPI00155707B8|nr:hypothetical protein [Bradyrhizobium aeschynomenes]NPV22130.1 hypothetical protein [Bradyrhizobium aeschynomenes]